MFLADGAEQAVSRSFSRISRGTGFSLNVRMERRPRHERDQSTVLLMAAEAALDGFEEFLVPPLSADEVQVV